MSVAKEYQNQGLKLCDLINEGNIGILRAAARFDETRGFKFISYAVWWIRESILQAIAEKGRIVRVPQNKISAYNSAAKKAVEFVQENEREPSTEELAEVLDLSPKETLHIISMRTWHDSLDAPATEDSDATAGDNLAEETGADAAIELESLRTDIRRVLWTLKPREADIISAYSGLDGMTVEQVCDKYDLTKERVRQLYEKSLCKLRQPETSRTLRAYLG